MSSLLAFIPPPPTDRFHIGPLVFHLYGLAIAIGVLCAFWLARRRWQQAGRDPAQIEVAGIWAVVAGFIGGRAAYVSTHTGDFAGRWLHIFAIWEGGLALYGGLTLGILTGILVAWRRGLPVLLALDAAIPAIPLAQAFGRWGNYFNQELFGTPTRLPWALEVTPAHRPLKYQAVATFHPTFLYESLWDLLIVGVLLWLSAKRRLRVGSIVLCYLAMYAVGRLLLELIRTDTTFRLFGLSRNAWVSLGVMVGAGAWLYLRERRGPAAELGAGGGVPGAPGGPGPDREPATVAAAKESSGGERAAAPPGAGGAGTTEPGGGPSGGSNAGGGGGDAADQPAAPERAVTDRDDGGEAAGDAPERDEPRRE
jgi:prolipoprotein diacylglyceryl transferase